MQIAKESEAELSLGELAASRRKPLLSFIRTRVQSLEDAEDIVQDVLMQLVRSADTLAGVEDITAWLYRVARNKVTDWYRKSKPVPLSESEEFLPTSSAERPDSILARNEIWTTFIDTLAELPPKQREVFVMHELEGTSFEEIARITGVGVNTLLSRKRYAVIALRRALGPLYNELFLD